MNEILLLSVNTTTTVGTIAKIKEKDNEAELNLKIPLVLIKGNKAGIARNLEGHWRLIGFGNIN